MIKRIVEIGNPAFLSVRHGQMRIERDDALVGEVPIEDLGVLILDHPAVTHTQALLAACFSNNVAVIVCDGRHHPGAVLLPMDGHSLHAKVLGEQISASAPRRKRLWQTIVQAKIREQARVLESAVSDSGPLRAMAGRVRSGDPDNVEAQAAREYWKRLFGRDFRRDRNGGHANPLLNYGYTILRAAVARAIVGAGLHPALGVQHSNQYNAFALADDLLEPLRPLADIAVFEVLRLHGGVPEMTPDIKRELLGVLSWDVDLDGRRFPLMVALHHYASSVREVLAARQAKPEIPTR